MIGATKRYLRYGLGVYRFLKRPLSLAECYAIVRERVENRDGNFLAMLERGVYSNLRSPYRRLLEHARCELGDVESMVKSDGLEATLRKLSEAGVYITVEEYKGKKPVERNGLSFVVHPEDFDNPEIRIDDSVEAVSGATRSKGIRTHLGFDFLTHEAAVDGVFFDGLGLNGATYALYHDFVEGLLKAGKRGVSPQRWFFPVSSNKNKLRCFCTVAAGRMLGYSFAWPELIDSGCAWKVAEWLAKKKSLGFCIVVSTIASAAVRVCLAAGKRGLDISGTVFITGAEPMTAARQRQIEVAGCRALVRYVSSDMGSIGLSCATSTGDDTHFLNGHLAAIRQPRLVGSSGLVIDALRFTTLLATAPKIFINAENGDYARLATRRCGCQFDELGLTDHLSHIRSFEKLTSEGMTFFAGDLVRIVEEVLPVKFGGSPLDYQAVEEETENGLSHFTMLVSPKVGEVDEEKLVQTIFEELKKGGANNRRMGNIWEEAGTVRVRREEPQPTRGGKIFPFQVR